MNTKMREMLENANRTREAAEKIPAEIKKLNETIDELTREVGRKRELLKELVHNHHLQIVALAEMEARRRDIGFCSCCRNQKSLKELVLVYIRGERHGSKYADVHCLCPDCNQIMCRRSGMQTGLDPLGREIHSWYVYPIEERDGKYFVRPIGSDEMEVKEPASISSGRLINLIKEWGLPALLAVDYYSKTPTVVEVSETIPHPFLTL